jgi:hypothetical protein
VIGLAAALLAVPAMLVIDAPASAQSATAGSARSKAAMKDITEKVGDKQLKVLAGIQANDTITYNIGYHGEAVVSANGAMAASKSTSGQILDFTFRKSTKDGEPMDVEVKCILLSFTHESQASGQDKGRVVSFSTRSDGDDDGNGLFIDGIEETSPPKGMPTASTVKSNMGTAVAFGRIGKDHQDLSRPAHSARFTDTAEENIPHNLLDPVTAMRLVLAGYAGRDIKAGESMSFDAMLSTDTTGSAPVPYAITMTAEKILSTGDEAEAVAFAMTATPKDGAAMDLGNGVSVKAPVLTGHATVELKRGVVLVLMLKGEYTGDAATGSISIRADLVEKKRG